MTGDEFLTDYARTLLLCQPTLAVFTCSDSRCPHSLHTWEAELPSIAWGTPRNWPKCQDAKRHRAKLLEIARSDG